MLVKKLIPIYFRFKNSQKFKGSCYFRGRLSINNCKNNELKQHSSVRFERMNFIIDNRYLSKIDRNKAKQIVLQTFITLSVCNTRRVMFGIETRSFRSNAAAERSPTEIKSALATFNSNSRTCFAKASHYLNFRIFGEDRDFHCIALNS